MKNRNELIVVLATTALVAIMLFNVLSIGTGCSSDSKAKQAHCVSNLSQIGKAVFQYSMMCDDWYPTSSRTSTPKWMNGKSGESFNLLFNSQKLFIYYSDPLLPDPMVYLCPSKKGISPVEPGKSLQGHVSYNWCDGLTGTNAIFSPIACDGTDNHSDGTGRFLRGDGSVGIAVGTRSVKWTQDKRFKDFCYGKTYTDYSFK